MDFSQRKVLIVQFTEVKRINRPKNKQDLIVGSTTLIFFSDPEDTDT